MSKNAEIARNIITESVGTKGVNHKEDVLRLKHVLCRTPDYKNSNKHTIKINGDWDEATEELLADALDLMFSNFRSATIRPLRHDSATLMLAKKAGLAFTASAH